MAANTRALEYAKSLKREALLQELQPYWEAVQATGGGLVKSLETFVYVVSRGRDYWTYLIRHSDELLNQTACDELARVYLAAHAPLGGSHHIPVLLLDALNILSAATVEGAQTMNDLIELKTKASFIQRERAKERYLNDEYAHSHPLLIAYFAESPRAKSRFKKLWIAALILLLVNIALYFWRNSLPEDHHMSPLYRLKQDQAHGLYGHATYHDSIDAGTGSGGTASGDDGSTLDS